LTFSEDKFYATVTIPHGSQSVDPIFKKLMANDNTDVLDHIWMVQSMKILHRKSKM
jgi:hypothetical protein